MLKYRKHYENCKNASQMGDPQYDLYDFTHIKSTPGDPGGMIEFPDNYLQLVDTVAAEVDERIKHEENIFVVPDVKPGEDAAVRLKGFYDMPGLEGLADEVLTSVEKKLYGCDAYLFGLYIYRTSPNENYVPRASWLWHMDNHPKEVIKVMVYLTDVGEENGPFTVLTHPDRDNREPGYKGCKQPTSRIDYTKWQFHPSRYTAEEINKAVKAGAKVQPQLGPKGSVVAFDNNILHRANLTKEGHRDVAIFMIKPHDKPLRPRISKDYTGTNYHKDVFVDPTKFGAFEK